MHPVILGETQGVAATLRGSANRGFTSRDPGNGACWCSSGAWTASGRGPSTDAMSWEMPWTTAGWHQGLSLSWVCWLWPMCTMNAAWQIVTGDNDNNRWLMNVHDSQHSNANDGEQWFSPTIAFLLLSWYRGRETSTLHQPSQGIGKKWQTSRTGEVQKQTEKLLSSSAEVCLKC